MLQESLYIRNFGPIAEVEIPYLKKINVFIGESATGKSTIMKVLAMLRWVYKLMCIRSYLKYSGLQNSPFRFHTSRILEANGLAVFIKPNTLIQYSCGSTIVKLTPKGLEFPSRQVPREELSLEKIAYISDKRAMVPDLARRNADLRHGMFYLEETLLNFQKAAETVQDTELPYLGVKMETKRNKNGQKRIVVSPLSDNTDYQINLAQASSGIQSTVALHYILTYFSRHYNLVEAMNGTILKFLALNDNLSRFKATHDVGSFPNKRISLHVEEPELSLFPSNQYGLMRFMVENIKNSEANTDLNLTFATHSPYILTALNVMIKTARALEINPKIKEVVHDLPPALGFSEVGAWEIKDGRATDLMDQELLMIDGTWLDSVSDQYENLISVLNEVIYG